jgi:hypothetical protein
VATARNNTRAGNVHPSSTGTYPGNAPPAEASTKRGATSARPGKRREQRQGLRTTCGHTTTQSRRHQEAASHRRYRLLLSEGVDPYQLLHRRSQHQPPGTDRRPDEDRRGRMLEPPSTQQSNRTRQHRRATPKAAETHHTHPESHGSHREQHSAVTEWQQPAHGNRL